MMRAVRRFAGPLYASTVAVACALVVVLAVLGDS